MTKMIQVPARDFWEAFRAALDRARSKPRQWPTTLTAFDGLVPSARARLGDELDIEIRRVQTRDGVDYEAALHTVRQQRPELFEAWMRQRRGG